MTTKDVYRSKIDWWVWAVLIVWIAAIALLTTDVEWWVALIFAVGALTFTIVSICGCWYAIDGDDLIVYQFFRPNHFPISKIKEVKKTTGYLATAGMSSRRVSIKFTDRSVMKSAMPLEISPADRDGFIARLQSINPSITEPAG